MVKKYTKIYTCAVGKTISNLNLAWNCPIYTFQSFKFSIQASPSYPDQSPRYDIQPCKNNISIKLKFINSFFYDNDKVLNKIFMLDIPFVINIRKTKLCMLIAKAQRNSISIYSTAQHVSMKH